MPDDRMLHGGGRFRISATGDPPVAVKTGPADAIDREVSALERLAGTGLAPDLVGHGPGTVTMTFVDGPPRTLAELSVADARILGDRIRHIHDTVHATAGGRHVWPRPAASLDAYARLRIADLDPVPDDLRGLMEAATHRLLPVTQDADAAFRFLHGDLVAANILWTPAPVLVDWEFWRTGDPAEDLAYLAVMNDVPAAVMDAVLTGYAGDAALPERVEAWRAACALDAGLWYRRQDDPVAAERLIAIAETSLDR